MNLSASAMHDPAEPSPAPIDDGGYFNRYHGVPLAHLLAPLDGASPAGPAVRGTMVYRMVEQARRSDDATLPMGSWAVELKRANWPKASASIISVLSSTAKDLQLAAWLLEADIHQRGFAALAPCIGLLDGLCRNWWGTLHPQADNGDYEARINVLRWVNEKLLPTLSLIPLVDDGEHEASWSQWDLAHHYERLRAVHGSLPDEAENAATLDDLHELLAQVSLQDLRERYAELAAGCSAIAGLEKTLRVHLGYEAPSLGKLDSWLLQAQAPLRAEITRRGATLRPVETAPADAHDDADDELVDNDHEPIDHDEDHDEQPQGDRDSAYRALAEIADFLAHIEPHSPVPYLIRRAVAWGQLNVAELYQELFVKSGGQISVTDLLGLDTNGQGERS